MIDSNFSNDFNNFFTEVKTIIKNNISKPDKIWPLINDITNRPKISLEASYKVSPILGEINDFALNILKDTIFEKFLPVVISDKMFDYWQFDAQDPSNTQSYERLKSVINRVYNIIAPLVPSIGIHINEFKANIINVKDDASFKISKDQEHQYWTNHTLTAPLNLIDFNVKIEEQDKSPYGFILGPYFMCLGMWVGTLLLTFTLTRNKDLPQAKFWTNYLAKTLWMVIFGLIQSTILVTSLLLLFNNADLWMRFWQLFLYMWVVASIFDLIVQSIAHMFKNHDIGRLIIVILLILQLSASSGTFPVELEPPFFQFMYHILPFSYAIKGLREILINPNTRIICWTIGCLLLFIIILVPLSLLVNWFHDYKIKNKIIT